MSPEVTQIFKEIDDHSKKGRFGPFMAESKLEKILIILGTVTLVATVVISLIKPIQQFALITGVIFILSVILLLLVQALSFVALLARPMRGYVEAAKLRLERRTSFIQGLSRYKPESLETVALALERDASRMKRLFYSIVGSLEKAGIVPALLALVYASFKFKADLADSYTANIIMALVFGMYGGAFIGQRLTEALESTVKDIREAAEISSKRQSLSGA